MDLQYVGTVFGCNTQQVHKIIQELTLDSSTQDWIKGIDSEQLAMEAYQTHFGGEAEGQHHQAQAHVDLDFLFYRNEQSFSFENYVTKLKSCFDVLELYKVPKHEEENVKLLLQKIQTSSYELKTEIRICRDNHSTTPIYRQVFPASLSNIIHEEGAEEKSMPLFMAADLGAEKEGS